MGMHRPHRSSTTRRFERGICHHHLLHWKWLAVRSGQSRCCTAARGMQANGEAPSGMEEARSSSLTVRNTKANSTKVESMARATLSTPPETDTMESGSRIERMAMGSTCTWMAVSMRESGTMMKNVVGAPKAGLTVPNTKGSSFMASSMVLARTGRLAGTSCTWVSSGKIEWTEMAPTRLAMAVPTLVSGNSVTYTVWEPCSGTPVSSTRVTLCRT
mmetsp:Transcript_85568/g.141682  ORF Transcript_85568/g.141682 Transcript_85568/m.141682 type:complete len:216 (-) Transcript_85568:236-883(-)